MKPIVIVVFLKIKSYEKLPNSISQLSDTLKRNDINSSDIHYLLIRYIEGMYLLSVAYNNNSAYIELSRKNNLSTDHYDIWAYPKTLS